MICLSIDNEDELIKLFDKVSKLTKSIIFFEPDINEYTSICLYGTPQVRKILSNLGLCLRDKKEVVNV